MRILKAIGTSLIISLLFISVAQASEFGSYNTEVEFEQKYQESLAAVEASKKLRRSLRNDRTIAGMSTNDQRWASDFKKIMADNNTDYLKKAYQLID